MAYRLIASPGRVEQSRGIGMFHNVNPAHGLQLPHILYHGTLTADGYRHYYDRNNYALEKTNHN